MKVIVVGCGRVGSYLAGFLRDRGSQVTVVDKNPGAFRRLGEEFVDAEAGEEVGAGSDRVLLTQRGIRCVLGLAIDEDVLRTAGIEGAEALTAVTDDDYTNIMAGLMAREMYRVPRVIARITDPRREQIFHEMGLETICPTTLGARSIVAQLEAPPGGP